MDKKENKEQELLAETLGAILSDLRKDRGMTQKVFAKEFNISEGAVSHYELGVNLVSPLLLCEIANFYHIPVDYLLGRCLCKVEYSKLNNIFTQNVTLGEIVNMIDDLPKGKKSYLYQTILLLKNSK